MKIEWFEERTGDGSYQHVSCGWSMDITYSPQREAIIRDAEREAEMMRKALSQSIFGSQEMQE